MTRLSLPASSCRAPLQARSLRNPGHLVVKVVIVLMLGVQILVLSLVLRVEVLMFSAVLGVELTVETTVLPPGHRIAMSFAVDRLQILVLRLVLRVEVLVLSLVLGVQALVLSPVLLILVMGRDNWCSKQHAGEWKHGKGDFLQVGLHTKPPLFFEHSVSAKVV